MRVESWNPNAMDQTFENVAMERLLEAADVVKSTVKAKLASHIGSGKTTGISRPIYRRGPYAGQPWTKRNFGELGKSVRVVQKKSKTGKPLARRRDVRVYAGNYFAYYARIFEHSKPFMRPGLEQALPKVRAILGVR